MFYKIPLFYVPIALALLVTLVSGESSAVIPTTKSVFKPEPFHADDSVRLHNFDGANLTLANFSGTDASLASFRNANMAYANLSVARFVKSDLSGVNLRFALIEFIDFTEVKGLTAEQLEMACLPKASEEDKINVPDFDVADYKMPSGCEIWEHVPRG